MVISNSKKQHLLSMLTRLRVTGLLVSCSKATGYKMTTLNAYGRESHPTSDRAYKKIKAYYNHTYSINEPVKEQVEEKVIVPTAKLKAPEPVASESLIDKLIARAKSVVVKGDSAVFYLTDED